MTINQLCSILAKKEGKKVQVRIGDIREIIRLLRAEIKANPKKVLSLLLR